MRKAAVVVAVVVLVLALVVALVPRVVSLDHLKPRILSALEEKTGRKVAFSRLSLFLFPTVGVRVSDLTVSGDPGHPDEKLLSVPEADLRVAILPLLAGRTELSTFLLRRPEILFRKYRDGTHSATEIAARLAKKEAPARDAATPPKAGAVVTLASIRIEEAKLSLRIEEAGGGETRWDIAPFSFRLAGIGTERNEFELGTRIEGAVRGNVRFAGTATHQEGRVTDPTIFDVAGEGTILGLPLSVAGKMSAPQGVLEVDLAVSLQKIPMRDLPAIFRTPPEILVRMRPEGFGKVGAKIAGDLQSLGFEVEADLTQAGWTLTPDVAKFIDTPLKFTVQGHWFPDLLVLSNAELSTPPLLVIANASLVPSTGAREWAASSRITSLREYSRIRGGGLEEQWSPQGRVTASARGKRKNAAAKDDWRAGVDLVDIALRIPGRGIEFRDLNGHLEATPETVEFLPLAGLVNGQRFSLRGSVATGDRHPGEVEFRMAYLDFDNLFPPGAKAAAAPKTEAPAKKAARTDGTARSASVKVLVFVDAGRARGVEFRTLSGAVRYAKGTVLLENLSARIYGGQATVSGRLDLFAPRPEFNLKVAMKDVDAGEILKAKTSLGDLLSGRATVNGEIGGPAKDFAEFSRAASGGGSVRIADGRIKGIDLLLTAVRLSGLSALFPGGSPAGAAGAVSGETAFRDLSADVRIGAGAIRTDALRIVSEKMGLEGSASFGFDRTVEFRGLLRLPKETSGRARGVAGRFLRDPEGRVAIPLVMSGSVASPAVAIDTAALARGFAESTLRDLVGGSAEGASPAAPKDAGAGGPAPPAKDGGAIRKGIGRFLEGILPKR